MLVARLHECFLETAAIEGAAHDAQALAVAEVELRVRVVDMDAFK
jgi:hypothetical protein